MEKLSPQSSGQRQDWSLTAAAFHRLLTWLEEDQGSSGDAYLELRRRLVGYFDRKKCRSPEDLTDEVLNRVARRLEEEGQLQTETPAKYCYIVARFVFMEYLRAEKSYAPLEEAKLTDACDLSQQNIEQAQIRERMLSCLERCTQTLDSNSRELIFDYYIGKEQAKIQNRRMIAERLAITQNALSIRACRIRERLRACVERCLAS